MGTSLSGIDAVMAVAVQHGRFIGPTMTPRLQAGRGKRGAKHRADVALRHSAGSGFYCPIPGEPLSIVSESAMEQAIAAGSDGLLDRVFELVAQEITLADPLWSENIALHSLNADSFSEAWFAKRQQHNPFHWALDNLEEVERNKRAIYGSLALRDPAAA